MKETKICNCCGDEFIPRAKTSTSCRKVEKIKCVGCGKIFDRVCTSAGKEYTKIFCNKSCSMKNKRKRNNCLLCGDPCIEKYCNKTIEKTCKACNKTYTAKCNKFAAIYCSKVCSDNDPERINRALDTQRKLNGGKLGFNNDKQRKTMLERYGHTSPAKNEKVKEKARATQYKNNDGKFAFNTDKQKETMMKKYGSLGRLGNKDEQERQKKILLEKYGVEHLSQSKEFMGRALDTIIDRHGHLFGSSAPVSKLNKDFAKGLEEEFGVSVEFEKKVGAMFIDLYIPEANLYIDLNPTVTHNSDKAFACLRKGCEEGCLDHKPTKRDYHFNRAQIAHENGLKYIQIFDWDDMAAIKRIIRHRLVPSKNKISAHGLKVVSLKSREANKFLKETHIQGGGRGQSHLYGLEYKGELVAVATFGKSRFKSKAEYEFIRYAVKEDFVIYGGAKRLFNKFIEEVNPLSVISYIDFNHTTSDTYLETLGFEEIMPTGAREMWTKKGLNKAYPVTSLLRIGADRLLGTHYGPKSECGLDNAGIMRKEGYVRVYTAGNRVFIYKRQRK